MLRDLLRARLRGAGVRPAAPAHEPAGQIQEVIES